MRILCAVAVMFVATGCGQTGALYLPDESVETPVEIRTPGEPAPDKEEEKKSTQPQGR